MSKPFSYDQVYSASLKYFDGDELPAKVFTDKYALREVRGSKTIFHEKDPDAMHRRLAREFARTEDKYPNPLTEDEIYSLLKNYRYVIPQGSPMAVIGNPYQVASISNCVVLEKMYDSYGGIMYADQQISQSCKRRVGIGLDISPIRPRGMAVLNTAMTTDGIASFMERFSNTIREVGQNSRRGAGLLSISVHHPEVLVFATIKNDPLKVTGANISVFLTNEFLKAVERNGYYEQRWPVDSDKPIIKKKVKARDVWNTIIESAHNRAEPGLMFLDRIHDYHPPSSYEGWEPHCTNPCSEIPMNNDSCRLMALNMTSFVNNPFSEQAVFDFKQWQDVVYKAQRLMDDLVDLEIECVKKILQKIESDPEPEHIKAIEIRTWERLLENAELGRRTGLGITGLGDTIASLGMRYGSDASIKFVDKAFKLKKGAEYLSSIDLAKERGAFPIYSFQKEKDNQFIVQLLKDFPELKAKLEKYGRRNIAISTVAPTGSISTQTKTSSGIEPEFMLSYIRKKKINPTDKDARVDSVDALGDKWQHFKVYSYGVQKWMRATGETDIKKSPYWGATANDLDYKQRVKLQAAIQVHTDHSISSTVNIANNATVKDVRDIYTMAWKAGCKGITVYRDGCRSGVLVSNESEEASRPLTVPQIESPKRPTDLVCNIHHVKVSGQDWICFVGLLENSPYEIFTGLEEEIIPPKKLNQGVIAKTKLKSRSKYDLYFFKGQDNEIIFKDIAKHFLNKAFGTSTRLISTSLRHGIPIEYIVNQLQRDQNEELTSFHKVVARVLQKYIKDGKGSKEKCSNCNNGNLIYQEGCLTCKGCGYSRCT